MKEIANNSKYGTALSIFAYVTKYRKGSTNVEADVISRLPGSEHAFYRFYFLGLQETKEIQQKENFTIADKKFIEINDVVAMKKKSFYRIVVPFILYCIYPC